MEITQILQLIYFKLALIVLVLSIVINKNTYYESIKIVTEVTIFVSLVLLFYTAVSVQN